MSRSLSLLLILSVNALFVYKYGERATGLGLLLTVLYCLLVAAAIRLVPNATWAGPQVQSSTLEIAAPKRVRQAGWLSVSLLVLAAIVTEATVPLTSLNVDRWSVIASFVDALVAGDYPYFATSHLGNPPGPMPVYFVLAAPFYWIDQLALLSIAGYVGAVYWLVDKSDEPVLGMVLLMLSPAMYWEIATRSNIFTYSILVLWGLEQLYRQPTIWQGAITGLLLATRSVFGISYLVYFGSMLWRGRIDRWRFVGISVVALLSFALTFLPFVIRWPDAFWEMNPFLVQSTYLIPLPLTLLFLATAAIAALVVDLKYLSFVSGMLLYCSICVYAMYHIIERSFSVAIHGSVVDVSYFLFAIPFLGYHWARSRDNGGQHS